MKENLIFLTKSMLIAVLAASCLASLAYAGDTTTGASDVARLDLLDVKTEQLHTISLDDFNSALILQDGFLASRKTFPAVSHNRNLFALLIEPEPYTPTLFVEVRNRSGTVSKKFEIVSRQDERDVRYSDASALARVRENISTANIYLAQHQFRPMQLLFRKSYMPDQSLPSSVTDADGWIYRVQTNEARMVKGNYDLSFALDGLTISRYHSQPNWTIVIPHKGKTYPAPPDSGPDNDCHVAVHPSEGWIDEASETIVIRFTENSATSCEMPDDWVIYPFPK